MDAPQQRVIKEYIALLVVGEQPSTEMFQNVLASMTFVTPAQMGAIMTAQHMRIVKLIEESVGGEKHESR
jgi:hypothetical protein